MEFDKFGRPKHVPTPIGRHQHIWQEIGSPTSGSMHWACLAKYPIGYDHLGAVIITQCWSQWITKLEKAK